MIISNFSSTTFSFVLPDGGTQTESKDSNIVNTEILTDAFSKVKTSNKTFLREGETAEQTVTLTNNSQATIESIIFKDMMTSGATYVPGSVIVDGVSFPAYDLVAGFPINNIAPNGQVVIKYTIIANNPMTETPVVNFANIAYSVGDDDFAENTNEISLPIVSGRMSIVKEVDKAFAVKGETLHYTSTIINTGSLTKTDITFTDTIPVGSTFVPNSVKIGGISQPGLNPAAGFALPDLLVGESVVVEFDVTVN